MLSSLHEVTSSLRAEWFIPEKLKGNEYNAVHTRYTQVS